MKRLFRILYTGVDLDDEIKLRGEVLIVNMVCFTAIFFAFIFSIYFFFTVENKLWLISVSFIEIYFIPVLINKFKRYSLAKILFLLTIILTVYFINWGGIKGLNMQFLLILPIGLSFVIFNSKAKLYRWLIIGLALLSFIILHIFNFSFFTETEIVYIDDNVVSVTKTIVGMVILVIIILIFNIFIGSIEKSEDKLRKWDGLFKNIKTGIILSYDGHTLDSMNPEFARIYGYSIEELEEKTLESLFVTEEKKRLHSELEKIRKKGHHVFESYHKRKDGSEFPVVIDGTAVKDETGQVLYWAINIRDITDSKEAEIVLKESEELFRVVFEQAAVGVAIADWETSAIVRANKKLSEITAYSMDELKEHSFNDIIHPDDRKVYLEYLERLKSGLITDFSVDKRFVGNDKTEVWVQLTLSRMMKATDRKSYLFAVVQDITERIKVRQSLLKSSANLKEANETKDKLFSIIAHDLIAPFNIILSFSQLLNKNYYSLDESKKKYFISNIEKSTKTTYMLLENLLYWARSQQNRIAVRIDKINLAPIIKECVNIHYHVSENKNIEIRTEVNEDLMVNADKTALTVVIRNLLSNALKFSFENSVIDIKAEEFEDIVSLTIQDYGMGMKKEQLDNFFADKIVESTLGTSNEQGTGLGLRLCKEFIEKNNGKILVESEQGKGTKFVLQLQKSK